METELSFRRWVEQLTYRLLHGEAGDLRYALFLHHVHVVEDNHFWAPAYLGLCQDGRFILGLSREVLEPAGILAATEVLKHEVLHLIFGHVHAWRSQLVELFDRRIYNLAVDMVVNQYIKTEHVEAAGLSPVTAKKFGYPEGKSTLEYCKLLDKDKAKLPKPLKIILELAGTPGKDGKALSREELRELLKNGVWEAVAPEAEDGKSVEEAIVKVKLRQALKAVEEEAGSLGESANMGRGWASAELAEMIKQLDRAPTQPWHAHLRRLETLKRGEIKEPSLRRPSRRGPSPPYLGRRKKNELEIWFGVDTSGSMGAQQLRAVNAELRGIAQRGAKIWVFHVDAGIAKREVYSARKGLSGYHGRGGTEFSPFFLELLNTPARMKPGLVVYYTDGWGGLEAYERKVQALLGTRWDAFLAKQSSRTPDGVELLWLLPDTGESPKTFKEKIARFGAVSVLPVAGSTPKDDT